MDIFDGANLYDLVFTFRETDPLNKNYALLGIENKNYSLNSGSYFILMVLQILFYFMQFALNFLAIKLANFKIGRKLGMKMYSSSYIQKYRDSV